MAGIKVGALVAAAAAIGVGAIAGPATATVIQLSSPTGKIGCVATDMDNRYSLRCDVQSPTYPRPPRAKSCPPDYGEYGDSIGLNRRGRAYWVCHGDTALRAGQPGFRTLGYGRTWKWGPFRSTMRTSGITCSNTGGYGFKLSQQAWGMFAT